MSLLKGTFAAGLLAGVLALVGGTGCTTDAFCFTNCSSESTSTGTGGSTSSTTTSIGSFTGTGGGTMSGCFPNCGNGGNANCTPTNGGIEICDGIDNDCNGTIDDIPGLDLTDAHTCGTCSNDCFSDPALTNFDPTTITCTQTSAGMPGKCGGSCAQDYYDLDPTKPGCEYYCVKGTDPGEEVCNGLDDDCNGQIDENVNLCLSTTDCGKCGHNCVVLHGSPKCVNDGTTPCDSSNTQCEIASCDCTGPGDCWHDIDGSIGNGCEYPCFPTNGGVEICDGIDNDCDGTIDDNLGGDPEIGATCFGGTQGECAAPAHAGAFACVGGTYVCQGPNVLLPNTALEKCNGLDDDCDGTADDNLTDTGAACGVSNIFPCSFGSMQCVNKGTPSAALGCVGEKDPAANDPCDGVDEDCDGTADNHLPPNQQGACNIPIPPPAGATSPCKAGNFVCTGGVLQCVGSVGPVNGAQDTCGVDANCDGSLTNQPNVQTDVHNCGSCGHDCFAGAVHSNWTCSAGACVFAGCLPGFYDNGAAPDAVAGDHKCGYPCTFVSSQESCNGQDDNCDGQVDEGLIKPSPVQVCGVSAGATTPECTSGVNVTCQHALGWKCTFPAGVCNGSNGCANATEICDNLDNNCNGLVDENVPTKGQPCASDDGSPGTQGVCRTTGTEVCNGNNAVKCSAVKDNTKAGPELCDGQDNDCDGLIDEPYTNKGSNATFYVQPVVTKIAAATWIYSYEASRPNANATSGGTGNGFWCSSAAACGAGVTPAPAQTPLNKTPSCSVSGRVPWINVSPAEVEETCSAMGGHICSLADWQSACEVNTAGTSNNCTWGYSPTGAACTTGASYSFATDVGTKYCNLASSFDFNTPTTSDNSANSGQTGLLPTGSSKLKQCFAGWTGLLGNVAAPTPAQSLDKIYDITGNVREITKGAGTSYNLMGGSYDTASESGAACGFSFYQTTVTSTTFFDLGFRCCFATSPD